jgi:PAS domain S-box-containing protein
MTRTAEKGLPPGTSDDGSVAASDARCRALLANVADMVTISDRYGGCLYASPATEKVSGYTPEEFVARNPFDSIHPEDRPRCEEALAKLVDNPGLSLELEHRVRHKDGTWRWVEGTFTSLFDDSNVGGLLATVRDITERKQAEEALRESATRQAFLLQLSDALRPLADAVAIQGEACRLLAERLDVDRAYYVEVDETAGLARVERDFARDGSLVGEHRVSDFSWSVEILRRGECYAIADTQTSPLVPSDDRAASAALQIIACIGAPLVKAGLLVSALCVTDSRTRDWSGSEVDLLREVGERVWAAVERARAEEALRESEERLQKAIAIETVGVFFLDREGCLTDANNTFLSMSGLGREDLESERVRWRTLTPPEWITHTERAFEELKQTGKTTPYEKEFLRKDGSRRWGLFAAARLDAQEIVEFVIDITERKRFEAEQARLRSREAAMRAETTERERISRDLHDRVAHSMGVVYQSLQLHKALAENAPERARQKLALAEETARNALDQTRNLAIELRRSVAEETEEGIAEALRSLLDTSAPDGVVTRLYFSGDESLIARDVGAQVYLVMREAIRNALKHSGCEEVWTNLEIQPDELIGTVTDDGHGFDPETTPDGLREGIGLRSMRERAVMVGGWLDLVSRPGHGTTVEIRVPLNGEETDVDCGAPK